jgi:hypothetical protein
VAAAGTVSGVYAAAGLFWAAGGPGFPFGAGDSQLEDNGDLLRDVSPGPGGAVMAVLGAVGVAAASAMARGLRTPPPPPPSPHRVPLLAFGAVAAAGLALVLPEARTVKYLPPLGILAFLRPPAWGTVNFLVLAVGGLAWAAATLAYARATSGGPTRAGAWLDDHRHAVTWTAIVAPWVYAGYRVCWALDVPIGVPQPFLDRINAANPGHRTRILELFPRLARRRWLASHVGSAAPVEPDRPATAAGPGRTPGAAGPAGGRGRTRRLRPHRVRDLAAARRRHVLRRRPCRRGLPDGRPLPAPGAGDPLLGRQPRGDGVRAGASARD